MQAGHYVSSFERGLQIAEDAGISLLFDATE